MKGPVVRGNFRAAAVSFAAASVAVVFIRRARLLRARLGETTRALTISSSVPIDGGRRMPLFGLGTWLARDKSCTEAVKIALSLRYPMVDTATLYENEAAVGVALKEYYSHQPQPSPIFVTTKLTAGRHGNYETVARELKISLAKLQIPAIDLWLMHTPRGGRVCETYKAMCRLQSEGAGVKAVGVSNFGVEQLKGLASMGLPKPVVNQIEMHPWLQQRETVAYCRDQGIVVTAYCPIARCKKFVDAHDPQAVATSIVAQIAAEHGRTQAQVCIRWVLQKGVVCIPKSSNAHRIAENADVFSWSLTDEDMARLERCDEGFRASSASTHMLDSWEDVS